MRAQIIIWLLGPVLFAACYPWLDPGRSFVVYAMVWVIMLVSEVGMIGSILTFKEPK